MDCDRHSNLCIFQICTLCFLNHQRLHSRCFQGWSRRRWPCIHFCLHVIFRHLHHCYWLTPLYSTLFVSREAYQHEEWHPLVLFCILFFCKLKIRLVHTRGAPSQTLTLRNHHVHQRHRIGYYRCLCSFQRCIRLPCFLSSLSCVLYRISAHHFDRRSRIFANPVRFLSYFTHVPF